MPIDEFHEQYYGRREYYQANFDPRDIYPWLQLSEDLTPFENLLLVGFLSRRGGEEIGGITPENIVGAPGVVEATEGWLQHNFREGLRIYCDVTDSISGAVAGESIKVAARELAPHLAGVFAVSLAVPTGGTIFGIAVGFSFFILQLGLKEWCKQNKTVHYSGEGEYTGGFASSPQKGAFRFTHKPAISEKVKNKTKYPIPIPEVRILVPAETSIDLYYEHDYPKGITKEIVTDFKKHGNHHFRFTDAGESVTMSGDVAKITYECLNALYFRVGNFVKST